MAIDKKELLKHYKNTEELLYRYETTNMQIYMAFGIIISLFLTAIGFIFSGDFPFHHAYIYIAYKINIFIVLTKLGILVIFGIILWYFYRTLKDRAETLKKYTEKRHKIYGLIIKDSEESDKSVYKDILFKVEEKDVTDVRNSNKKRMRDFKRYFITACILLAVFLFIFIRNS